MDKQANQTSTATAVGKQSVKGREKSPSAHPAVASVILDGQSVQAIPPVQHTNTSSDSLHQSLYQSAVGFAQQFEMLQERRPGLFCLTRSHSVIALCVACILIFPAGLLILILRNSLLGQMFLTSPLIGFVILLLCLTALCSLAVRSIAIALEWRSIKRFHWPEGMPDTIDHQTAGELLQYFQSNDRSHSILIKLIIDGLGYFSSGKDLADTRAFIETQSEHEAFQLHSSFSTINLIIWTLPILGFIGTVWGIGLAIGPFAVVVQDAAEIDGIKDGLINVIAGLSTAFQTTLLALVASVVVMFPRNAIQKAAETTLARIDKRVNRELFCRFADRVVLDSLEPESLLHAFDEVLNKYQRHWDRQTSNMVSKLAQELGARFQQQLAENNKHQNRLAVHFETAVRSTADDLKHTAASLSQAGQTTISAAAKTTEVLAKLGENCDQRLAEIAPGCEQLALQLATLSSHHESFCKSAAGQFSAVNASFERIGSLLHESSQQMQQPREVRLPEMSNEALIFLRKSLAPFAKIIQQQTEIQRRLLDRLENPATDKAKSTWFGRSRSHSLQPTNNGGTNATH